ncbi:FlgB family protein [Paenirhodobacter sp.]|uniref:FlgB family protein n=1 Tax=Paenirhodobacter sp. TaxID=1965326 RepID=UPI003B4235DD
MFEKLDILRTAQAMAVHATQRQNLIAQNVANADTPGYRSRDLTSFEDAYAEASGEGMRATRAGHLGAGSASFVEEVEDDGSAMSPDGNSVSIEDEMVKSVGVQRQHNLAMTIYKTSLGILRSSIGGA